jgi:hypothetical protein
LLCDACCVDVDDLCPEQFTARVALPTTPGANAFLFDGFGTPHVVSVSMPITSATIGRARTSDICIAERTVSQHHATLEYRPLSNAWYVVDGGSDNGTFVNTDRVARKFPLERADFRSSRATRFFSAVASDSSLCRSTNPSSTKRHVSCDGCAHWCRRSPPLVMPEWTRPRR